MLLLALLIPLLVLIARTVTTCPARRGARLLVVVGVVLVSVLISVVVSAVAALRVSLAGFTRGVCLRSLLLVGAGCVGLCCCLCREFAGCDCLDQVPLAESRYPLKPPLSCQLAQLRKFHRCQVHVGLVCSRITFCGHGCPFVAQLGCPGAEKYVLFVFRGRASSFRLFVCRASSFTLWVSTARAHVLSAKLQQSHHVEV